DGDTTWDRAVGPTQFIPSTWIHYAADGNNDGTADPNNIYDAALATARYLCSGGFDLTDPEQLRAAVYRYNHSDTYVNTVILWAAAYRGGVTPTPDSTVPTGTTHNTTTTGAPNPTTPPPPPTTKPPATAAKPRDDAPSTKLPSEVTPPSDDESEKPTTPTDPDSTDPDPTTPPETTPPGSTPPEEEPPTCEPVPVDPETGQAETSGSGDPSGAEPGDELPPCEVDSDGDGIADKLPEEKPSETDGNTETTKSTEPEGSGTQTT
ncbi:Transglycosylase SLT domain-containing protein, partial [Amycolatopsis marina]